MKHVLVSDFCLFLRGSFNLIDHLSLSIATEISWRYKMLMSCLNRNASSGLSQPARAATDRGLAWQAFASQCSGGWESKIKGQQSWFLVRFLFLAPRPPSRCVLTHTVFLLPECTSLASLPFLIRTPFLLDQGSTQDLVNLYDILKGLCLQKQSHRDLGLQPLSPGGPGSFQQGCSQMFHFF